MTEREQLLTVCRRNRLLAGENARLQDELRHAIQECRELDAANSDLRVERDAADVLLGEAMDHLVGGGAR
jgi:hypothetical protein